MKKQVKRSLWAVAIILGLIFIAAIIFLFNFIRATKSMTPAETSALNDSVWCIRDRFVNAFIFKGEKSYLMIDAGLGRKKFNMNTPEQIESLKILPPPGDFRYILTAHNGVVKR